MTVAGAIPSLVCLIVVGCGGSEIGDDVVPTASLLDGVEIVGTPKTSKVGDVDVVDPRSSDGPQRGGVFLTPSGNALIPDPALFSPTSRIGPLLGEIYSGLMQLTDDPHDSLRTDLAERYAVHDGVRYEFVLKRDLKFSDGSPVTASDFKWSWERALKSSTDSRHAREVFGMIEGTSAMLTGDSEELIGVEAVDDRTLLVTLSEPSAIFPFLMADPVAAVLKRQNVENRGVNLSDPFLSPSAMMFEELPVGTGPFKLAIFDAEQGKFALVRNDYYHEGAPYLDGVVYVTDLIEARDGRMILNLAPAFEEEG